MLQALDYATQLMALMDATVAAARMQHDVTPLLKVSLDAGICCCTQGNILGSTLTYERLWLIAALIPALKCLQQHCRLVVHHTIRKPDI